MLTWIRAMANDGGDLIEGYDYYLDDGLFVLTEGYLLRRGYCCGNGCRHCPYEQACGTTSARSTASRTEEEAP